MTTYTPATADIRRAYVWQRVGDDRSVSGTEANEEFTRWLATVAPNPDNKAQVEVVARVLAETDGHTWVVMSESFRESFRRYARAVLVALAALAEEVDK